MVRRVFRRKCFASSQRFKMPTLARGKRILGQLLVAAWVASFASGCAAVFPWHDKLATSGESTPDAQPENSDAPAGSSTTKQTEETTPPQSASDEEGSATASKSPPEQDELSRILDRLQRQGRLSPVQRRKLAQDLAMVDRSAWPILIQYFLASSQWAKQVERSPVPSRPPLEQPSPSQVSWPRKTTAKESKPASPPGAESLPPTAETSVAQAPPADTPTEHSPPKATAPPVEEKTSQADSLPLEKDAALRTTAGKADLPLQEKHSALARQPPSPQEQLQRLIASLEQQTQGPARSLEELQRHVYLRMLYLLAGRREQALEPIPGIPAPQQQYWTNQLYALAVYLDGETIPHSARRATEAKVHLDQAAYHLGTAGNLVVKNLAFCTAVRSYGVIGEFEQKEFRPGQVVLLYAELENFSAEETPEGYRTTLRGSYQIYDARGNQVASEELPVVEDVCRNRRRDFFVSYRIQLPERIYPGRHKLQLTIEDAKSQRMATGTLEFTVGK